MGSIDAFVNWFKLNEGKVTYAMVRPWGNGNPPQYDCSAAVITALRAGGFIDNSGGNYGNTSTLQVTTMPRIARQISRGECRRGDIFLANPTAPNGGDAHTGIFLDNSTIIHCNYGAGTISTTPANGHMGRQPHYYWRLNNGTSGGDGFYTQGSLVNSGHTISQDNIQKIINYSRQYNLKPSFLIAQLFIESHWGNSTVGRVDNNWSGISEPFTAPADLGITMSRGTARPAAEGGYYVRFATLNDFFNAYTFVLSRRNGLYIVEGTTSIEDYCRGLFRAYGAKADFASVGYSSYRSMLISTYNAINSQNPGKLAAIDSANFDTGNYSTEGEIEMQCLYQIDGKNAVFYFDGKEVRALTHGDEMKILQDIYYANNGKALPFFNWTSSVPWHWRLKGILERQKEF